MENPFEILEKKLNRIEGLLYTLKEEIDSLKDTKKYGKENLTIDQAIELLEENGLPITKAQIYKLSFLGEIPASRIGKRLIFSREDLLSWIESRKVMKVPPARMAAEKLAESVKRRKQ